MSALARKRWAQRALALEFEQLDVIRARAEQWRNGLAGLTALLATVTIIKGPDTTAKLSESTRTAVVNQLTWGFLLLLVGSLLAMLAAFGWPSGAMLLTGERLASWENAEASRARCILRLAAVCSVVGILLVGLATRAVLLERSEPSQRVLVDRGETVVCGEFTSADDGVLTLLIEDRLGDKVPTVVPFDAVSALRIVEECPSS